MTVSSECLCSIPPYSDKPGPCLCVRPKHLRVLVRPLFVSLPPHLYIHHLHRNCVHAVCTSNALPCCFWWQLVPSHTPSTKYKFPLACLSLCLDGLDVSLFIVDTLHPVCVSFCNCIPSKYPHLHSAYARWFLVTYFKAGLQHFPPAVR